ncbi:DNA primase family protein [Clostridium sp.]
MALKKAKKNTMTSEAVNITSNNLSIKSETKVNKQHTIIVNCVKPYTDGKWASLNAHLAFEWFKSNIKNMSLELLKCYISNLVLFGDSGKQFYSQSILEGDRSPGEYSYRFSNMESDYKKGVMRVASYEVLYALGYKGESFGDINPSEEIIAEVESKFEKELGLIKSSNRKYSINPNIFQRHFFSRVNIFKYYNDEYYIYNPSGYYRKIDALQIKKIAKDIVHEAKNDIWNTKMEKEIWATLSLEIPLISDINSYKEYINLNNGMYNIYTQRLESHDPKFFSTIRIPFNYNPMAKCPIYEKFLFDLMQGDVERISLTEEVMGYCLTTLKCIQKGFFFYGTGGNGKSKLADIITYLCGKDNVSNIPLEVLGTKFGAENLPNKLVNISAENEFKDRYMDTNNFKTITGGDPIHIDAKFKKAISYDVSAKLISLVNKLPDIKDTSDGYFRRVLIIPFYNTFINEKDDKEIVEKLLNELDGILILALNGLTRLVNNKFNLTESKAANAILNQYKTEQNPIVEFFQDKIICNVETQIKQCEILKHFKQWSIKNGYDDWSFISSTKFWTLFRKVLIDNGISSRNTKKIKGITYMIGITIE